MFYIECLTVYKVHVHTGAIRKLLYSCTYIREIIHSLKLVGYLSVHTQTPYNNLHLPDCAEAQAGVQLCCSHAKSSRDETHCSYQVFNVQFWSASLYNFLLFL